MSRELAMTDDEIRMRYKAGTSVAILADLNACEPKRIKEVIGDAKPKPEKKITVKQSQPRIMPKRTASEMHVLHCEMKKLYVKGCHDSDIAKQLNCSPVMVGEWRRKNDLPGNKQLKSGFNNSVKQTHSDLLTKGPEVKIVVPPVVPHNITLEAVVPASFSMKDGYIEKLKIVDHSPTQEEIAEFFGEAEEAPKPRYELPHNLKTTKEERLEAVKVLFTAIEVEAQPKKPVTHILKCQQPYFDEVWKGTKLFEARINDREYETGDFVVLIAFDPEMGCGCKQIHAQIGFLLDGVSFPGLIDPDAVVFSLLNIKRYEMVEWNERCGS